MKEDTLLKFIHTLDGMIATFQQAIVSGRTKIETEACQLLQEARLKIVEAYEDKAN